MSKQAYMAVVVSPEGKVWGSTASYSDDNEAEYKACLWAKQKFMGEIVGPFFKQNNYRLTHSFWDLARDNGWRCECFPVETGTKDPETG